MSDELRLTFKDKKTAWSQIQTVLFPALGKVLTGEAEWVLLFKRVTRSIEQNSRMWAMLADISAQVDWYGQKLTAEEWKDVLTASLKKQKAVPGIDGGFVVLGARTSKMTVPEMTELMDLMEAFGAQQGVKFSVNED